MDVPQPLERKRRRDDDDTESIVGRPSEKKARPTWHSAGGNGGVPWKPQDSVISTPVPSFKTQEQPKYDSDDQSSMVSEPGSPQALSPTPEEDISMDSDDEDMDTAAFSQSPEDELPTRPIVPCSPWRQRLRAARVPTPLVPPRPGARPLQRHIRQRHPQENIGSDRLEVPSPIDEDEVATPPSAAEAAGSRLELLSVSDVDMDNADALPRIALQPERSLQLDGSSEHGPEYERIGSTPEAVVVRKQRQRSGALSGEGDSPMRASPAPGGPSVLGGKRGFSMGFRADCEKCRMRVPGHMNHFIA